MWEPHSFLGSSWKMENKVYCIIDNRITMARWTSVGTSLSLRMAGRRESKNQSSWWHIESRLLTCYRSNYSYYLIQGKLILLVLAVGMTLQIQNWKLRRIKHYICWVDKVGWWVSAKDIALPPLVVKALLLQSKT